MNYSGINLEKLKNRNRSAILQVLQRQGAMSRKDLSNLVGLTPASVSIICTELLEEGAIIELGEAQEEKRAGRKKILIDINRDYKYVLCVGIESNDTYISVVNLAGEIIFSKSIPTDTDISPEEFLKKVSDECKVAMWEYQIEKGRIMAAGVSVPGMVDKEKGVILKPYNIWKTEVPVKAILEEYLGFEVFVENNAKAYAKTEIMFGEGRSGDHIFMLKWGPGVGSALILDGEVYYGSGHNAGEIGHMTVDQGGKLCRCGRRGCLETVVSTHAIMDSIMTSCDTISANENQKGALEAWLSTGHTMRYDNSDEWGVLDDPCVQSVLKKKAACLAVTVRNVSAVLDPDKIVVWGYLFDIPGMFEKFKQYYYTFDINTKPDFIVKSRLNLSKTHTEALAVVIDEMF